MKEPDKSELGFSTTVTILVVATVILFGAISWFIYDRSQNKTTSTSTSLSFNTINSADWEPVSKRFNFLKGALIFQYPPGWSFKEVTQSGHPNYATITSADKNQCIEFSVSRDDTTITKETKNILNDWNASGPEPNVLASTAVKTDGNATVINKVIKDNKEIYVAVAKLGKDSQFPTNTVYAGLTTCGVAEGDIFNAFVTGISS